MAGGVVSGSGGVSGSGTDVLVVGAGVVGLTTAIRAAEAGWRVRVRADRPPRQTTSALATAQIGPVLSPPGSRPRAWGQATLDEMSRSPGAPGVRLTRGILAARPAGMVPPFVDETLGYRPCSPGEAPAGFGTAFWVTLPLVDMPVYLDHLVERLRTAGGEIEIARVGSLDEAAEVATRVVNCTGLGARTLVPDPAVRPVRGPKIVVENPGLDTFFMEAPLSESWVGYHPHGDHVVVGSRAVAGDENTEPDPDEAADILRRCAEVEPRLAGARILDHRVGLRPGRPEVRLEAEPIGGARCVHNYGHGGEGVMLSWGCADEAVALLGAPGEPLTTPPSPGAGR
jgi:D-amino-acid oxidase